MAKVLLGVTGSVAAIRTPDLVAAIRGAGHEVRVVATDAALHFFDPEKLPHDGDEPVSLYRDADEWPLALYRRGDPVLHIEMRNWADVLVIAPLDAHTLGKIALGLSDNLLTCVFRAWDFARPVVLAPAMNTRMWESPVTRRHLRQLLEDHGGVSPDIAELGEAPALFARHAPGIILVAPQSKRLACGDVGIGAMAEVVTIAECVRHWARETEAHSPL
jgi:phosphopantothenoylcysteine decarboxylase